MHGYTFNTTYIHLPRFYIVKKKNYIHYRPLTNYIPIMTHEMSWALQLNFYEPPIPDERSVAYHVDVSCKLNDTALFQPLCTILIHCQSSKFPKIQPLYIHLSAKFSFTRHHETMINHDQSIKHDISPSHQPCRPPSATQL